MIIRLLLASPTIMIVVFFSMKISSSGLPWALPRGLQLLQSLHTTQEVCLANSQCWGDPGAVGCAM